ncbi:probable LRR receptor-like serine/threonine-protein kinase At4g36180 [Cynara cardunculus var. scolymus]|uniref:Leucine-rich repeat-containing protein n=1 Tax=Cynara cardunculus var. scolymus TaxID=59895 RepID=A0A118JV04_CYNCS|nr:probable LRR receptor-like serine/threonine-protein kinase At4g36180 [Cynara cardunculus var. scolymus]KVH93307.1 Leucine-rich repeat-containing protein [Cynara cardunculus var. scolymus]
MSTTVFFFLLLLSTSAAATTTTLASDVSALKAIKSAINPTTIPSYSCLASWNFTSDPCSNPHLTHFLCGLSCSGNRVTQLTFDRAGYSGTLSSFVSKLTQLLTIDLSDNKFSGPIPTALFFLPNLQTLILRSNSFSGTIPPAISSLTSIQTLDVSHNSLTGSLPDTLSSLTLTRLDLSFNKLTGPIPKLPKNLLELAIKSNLLSGYLSKTSFNELTQLEVVELSDNSLTGTIPGWFFLQPSIQQVNLANNGFTGIEILKPTDSNLIAVDIGFNKIAGYLSANFSAYPMLSSLSLRYNKLHGPIPSEYSQKATLRRLFLDGNYLSGLPPKEFFSGKSSVSGSLGDNCLRSCPTSSQLCLKSQKPSSICQRAYGGKVKPKS